MSKEMDDSEKAKFSERMSCISCGSNKLQELSRGKFDEGAVGAYIAEDPWGEHPAPFLKGKTWSFVTCQECGVAFHRYILSPEWNDRRFSKWMSQEAIEAFESQRKSPASEISKGNSYTTHVLQIEKLTRSLRGSNATRVLDFGCGYGGFLRMCSLYGFEAYGVDRSSAKRENNKFVNIFENIEDVSEMPPFHALTLFEVLEHLDDPHNLMLQLRDLLVPGGILVLETPNCSGVDNIKTRYDYDKIHPLEHINAFTPKTMKGFAARLGFEQISKPIAYVTCDSGKLDRKSVV